MPDEAQQNAPETSAVEVQNKQPEPQQPEADPPGAETLGDPGKKALDVMKAERNQYKQDLASLKSEFEAFRAKAEGKEQEHQAAQKVRDEALAAANQRILKAEVRAAAAGKLADPQDALRFLDLSEIEVDSDGNVKADLAATIEDLIKSKPYLAAQGRRFEGGADGGARKESRPAQLSRADLARMTPEAINEARAKGQLNDLLGVK